jgi:hypothetical protein
MHEESLLFKTGTRSTGVMLSDDIDMLLKLAPHGIVSGRETLECLGRIDRALNIQGGNTADISCLRRDIISLGCMLGLDFTRILAMVLKAWHEHTHSDDEPGSESAGAAIPEEILMEAYQELELKLGPMAMVACTLQEFRDIAQEMSMAGMHRLGNNSPELSAFKSRFDETTTMLGNATTEKQHEYRLLKTQWLHLQDEVGNCLTMLERRRLENATIKRNFLAEFGREYLEMQGQLNNLEGLRLRRNLLRADPDLSSEELEYLVLEAEQARQRALEKLRLELAFSTIIFHSNDSTSMSEDRYQRFKKKYKQLLRKVWLTIHPDQLQNNPEYGALTMQQQEYLKLLWGELMEIRPEETGYQKEQLGYTFRDMDRLAEIAQLADTILANAGINTSARMIIQGNTLEEQLNWLKERNRYLERQIDLIKIELRVMLEDRDMREKMAMLECSAGQKDRITKEMLARSKNYHEEADQIQAELESIMSQGA